MLTLNQDVHELLNYLWQHQGGGVGGEVIRLIALGRENHRPNHDSADHFLSENVILNLKHVYTMATIQPFHLFGFFKMKFNSLKHTFFPPKTKV